MPFLQLTAKIEVVVYLSVEGEGEIPTLIGHRLRAAGDVQYG